MPKKWHYVSSTVGFVACGGEKPESDVDVCVEMVPELYLFVELGLFLKKHVACMSYDSVNVQDARCFCTAIFERIL